MAISKKHDALSTKDITSWNSMTKGFGINHDGYMVVQCLKCMLKSVLKPDVTTFTCNIHCNTNGGYFLWIECWRRFTSLSSQDQF